MKTNNLVPLRIPASWGVIMNRFGDEDPRIEDGRIVNSDYFDEDLLVLYRIGYRRETDYATIPGSHVVDLAWRPYGDPDGAYRLTVIHTTWEDAVLTFSSRSRHIIRSVIEQCLVLIVNNVPDADIPARIQPTEADINSTQLL